MAHRALFLSPHLDDVAFSCGGTLVGFVAHGWETHLATAFTASVPDPRGFALACQLDKGLGPWVDYMALRRAEDRAFAAIASAAGVHHLDLPEAPHRDYGSPAELFGALRAGDLIVPALAGGLRRLLATLAPALVLAPLGLGGHVDHHQLVRALLAVAPSAPVLWYRDAPYAIGRPEAPPAPEAPPLPVELAADITPYLSRKLDAVATYATQLGFQFGGEPTMRAALAGFAREEAGRVGSADAAEAFRAAAVPEGLPDFVRLAPSRPEAV